MKKISGAILGIIIVLCLWLWLQSRNNEKIVKIKTKVKNDNIIKNTVKKYKSAVKKEKQFFWEPFDAKMRAQGFAKKIFSIVITTSGRT